MPSRGKVNTRLQVARDWNFLYHEIDRWIHRQHYVRLYSASGCCFTFGPEFAALHGLVKNADHRAKDA